ncbi:hypothetical protein ACFOY4_31390 [Actinomadura syzygii]|uniref:Uncharacterized protein n=1 Tax=Actinomadura syzygii TaxID=1427538 RepID=A0A5D0U9X7_9ACTN|nr:hypothetical protein [Actinomadura syzygii]TYC15361.1 hypothetical protein FXF65_14970 [Actinomadura syzygii]
MADGAPAVPRNVQEIGAHPIEYLLAWGRDAFDAKDRAVRHLRRLVAAAGLPELGILDVRHAPIVNGLAAGVANPHPVLDGRLLPPAHERTNGGDDTIDADAVTHEHAERARAGDTAARAAHGAATGARSGARPDRRAGGCARHHDCGGGGHAPVPAPGPEDPGNAPSGGHPLIPVADLRSARYPAAPPAVDPSTFHRTALTDVSAPGGPSVVPD